MSTVVIIFRGRHYLSKSVRGGVNYTEFSICMNRVADIFTLFSPFKAFIRVKWFYTNMAKDFPKGKNMP